MSEVKLSVDEAKLVIRLVNFFLHSEKLSRRQKDDLNPATNLKSRLVFDLIKILEEDENEPA